MTPKEKAAELIHSFKPFVQFKMGVEPSYVTRMAKQCALVLVDEMLNNAGYIWGGVDPETGLTARDGFRTYWNQVKEEIEAL